MAFRFSTFALIAATALTLTVSSLPSSAFRLERLYTIKGFSRFQWEVTPAEAEFAFDDEACTLSNQTNRKLTLLALSRIQDFILTVELDFTGRERSWAGILLDYNYYDDLEASAYTHIIVHSDGQISIGRTMRDAMQEDQHGVFSFSRKRPQHVSLKIYKLRDRLRVVANGDKVDCRLPEGGGAGNFGLLLAPYREAMWSEFELVLYAEPDVPFKGIKYKDLFGDPGATF